MKYSKYDDKAGIQIGGMKTKLIKVSNTRIIIDGGNLTHNGEGFGICTNRVIADNEYLFQDKIIEILKKNVFLKELLLIPSEFGDNTGHVDGINRFISKYTVIVSDYPYIREKRGNNIEESDYLYAKKQYPRKT